MHELSIAQRFLHIVGEEAAKHHCAKVHKIHLVIGALSSIEPECLRFCFDVVAQGSVAEKAELVIDMIPGRGTCPECGQKKDVMSFPVLCESCGHAFLRIIGGDEIYIKDMEV